MVLSTVTRNHWRSADDLTRLQTVLQGYLHIPPQLISIALHPYTAQQMLPHYLRNIHQNFKNLGFSEIMWITLIAVSECTLFHRPQNEHSLKHSP